MAKFDTKGTAILSSIDREDFQVSVSKSGMVNDSKSIGLEGSIFLMISPRVKDELTNAES